MPAPRNAESALRRFSAVSAVSLAVKLAAIGLLIVFVLKWGGGL